jgi:predicted AAA+ superfamily ATPase
MAFERHLSALLLEWKKNTGRKPLILRGARQVGKTTLIKSFSSSYKQKITLNLELEEHKKFFSDFKNVNLLTDALFISFNLTISKKAETLIFIDEIQESPEAIAMLRYFHEMEPKIHVIAAGSLLEHVLHKVKSFPVGRVQMLHLHPLNFAEFLKASGLTVALEQMHSIPIKKTAHQTLMDIYHIYAIIGGMPEVIAKYLETKSIGELQTIYESIWETYKDDVVKYGSNDTEARIIRYIMSNAHLYLDKRIKFQHWGNSNYKSREVGEAFRNLDDAKIIQLIYPTTVTEIPLKNDLQKSPRMQFLDTGLINNELNIQAEMLSMTDLNDAFRGAIIPHLIIQELISLNTTKATKPNFWVREKNQSSAEVDIVVAHGKYAIPIEIKSGKAGKLKSLHQFMNAAPHHFAIRMYAGNFSIEKQVTNEGKGFYLMNLPYYLGTKLHEYIEYFINIRESKS